MTISELFGIRIRRERRSLLVGVLFFLVIGVVLLQVDWAPPAKSQENVVTLDVAAIERDARAFGSLTKEEFVVYEDGVKQEIKSLTAQESPFSLGIAIDASGSMRSKFRLAADLALNVISRMRGADEAFVVAFKAEPELIQDFTSNQRALANAIGEIYTSGATALFDAVIATSDHVYKEGKSRRKALLFISDGLEKNSSLNDNKAQTALLENQTQAYFVCLPDQDSRPPSGGGTSLKPNERLDRLARSSGGQSFCFAAADEAIPVAAKLVASLRRQYEITYVSANNKQDDKLRKVKVVVNPKDGRKLNVITRQGYYSPGHNSKAVIDRDGKP